MSNEPFTGTVSTLAFGGSGIIKDEGLAIFCPFAIPGEKVKGIITERKKNYAIGNLTEVIEPSNLRIKPRCPYFGVCGGCQLQHMPMDAQLEWKRTWVKEALERIGGFEGVEVSPVSPSKPWAYRRRVNLTLMSYGQHFRAGYIAQDGRSFLETEVCPIFVEENSPILRVVQEIARELDSPGREKGKVSILKLENEQFILEFHFKKFPSNAEALLKGALGAQNSPISGILCRAPGKTLKLGKLSQIMEFEGFEITYSSNAFVQVNPSQSEAIYRELYDFVKNTQFSNVLDLYSGIGITSLLLSKYVQNITSIELDPEAVKLAKLNCRINQVKNIKCIEGSVEDQIPETEEFDAVLLNPPREGAGIKIMEQIALLKPKEIVYISCMPSTLARDLKVLREQGYQIKDCKSFDMFPQTTHVETFVRLSLT